MRKISLFLGTALMALMLMPSVAKADGSLNLSVFGIDVTDENAADILGDGQYKAVYDVETRTLTLSDLVINFAESDYNVSEGSVVEDRNDLAENGPLLVVINGHCEFTNTYLGFSSGFGINFSAAADGGELVLSGEQSQISADQVTIDGVDITAISSFGFNTPAVNAPDFLSILPNSHLVARSTNMGGIADDPDGGIAIVTAQLDMDESLEILTEGVHFYYNEDAGGSFYTDEENTSFAREVEIGKSKEMADLVFEDEAYYASLGCSRFESPVVSTLPEGLPVTYSSDDEEIATVDAQTGEVTLVAPGEVNICASFEGNDEYEGNEACYILYVEEAAMTEPSLEFEWGEEGVNAQFGMDFEGPALVNPEEVTISWSSSNEEVATVDEEGNITIVGIGETVISADFAGDACFSEAHAEYTLIVEEPQLMLRVLGVEVTMDNADDILADGGSVSYDLEVNTVRFDNVTVDFAEMPDSAQFIIVGDNEVGGPLEVNILGKCEFKNVSETGFAHPIGFRFWGSATDTLLCSGTSNLFYADRMFIDGLYAEFIADADLTVNADELHVRNNGHLLVKELNENGYAIQTYDLDLDDNIQILTKGVEFYMDSASWEAGFYLDADHSVLAREVEIGPVTVGLPIDLSVCGVEVTKENAADILGNGKAVYDIEHRILTFNNLEMDFENSEFMTEGGALVEDRNVQDIMGPLLVVINGRCSFTNTYLGFAGELGFNFGTEEKGELYLSGQMTQIQANEVTIDGVDITAIASFGFNTPAVSAWQSMTIVENGHLLAKNTNNGSSDDPLGGIGAETQMLVIDENMAILTKGVHHFEDPEHERGGFFTDEANSVYAREVEIGPKPVVVADDEVTTIDFTKTNPDGSEEVVVSLGANDSFNETTGQLEISTSLTDEQVEEALENLVPGSGAFAAALPGSITFDIPAGEGSIDIQCVTLPGYTLQVKIEGQAAISLTQTTFGWAHVDYKVAVPVHVVLYLHANANPMPARVRADNPSAALCIQAIKITPSGASESIEEIIQTTSEGTQKVLFDGQLYIVRDGKVFNAQGTEIR